MFKKIEDLGAINLTNKTFQRSLRKSIVEEYPIMEDYIDEILPKKGVLKSVRLRSEYKQEFILNEADEPIFIMKDEKFIPALRLLHRYPYFLPWMTVDKGAIKRVITGANVMCPGLTSPGGKMDDVPAGVCVAIMAEGKQHAIGVGITLMSTKEIREVNKGIALEMVHHLNDALWTLRDVKTFKNQ
eukprot:TRINITY_DN8792_c0_g2_i2.p1 TRINITY_DN8792_c0_g2~~TRINITY_DN8792_c0_g2_i2.p1  ORF type:complete len:186 (-),score=48.86 TRINITY_DN8792_c0_g2_i2:275-832(-)